MVGTGQREGEVSKVRDIQRPLDSTAVFDDRISKCLSNIEEVPSSVHTIWQNPRPWALGGNLGTRGCGSEKTLGESVPPGQPVVVPRDEQPMVPGG
jgi:hypothetical protein